MLMDARPFRWFPHANRRHAVPAGLLVYDEGATLCGMEITVPREPATERQWSWPTCEICDLVWRQHIAAAR